MKITQKNDFKLIEIKLSKYDLMVNPKSNIYKLNNSFTFLGRTYYIRNNKLLFICRSVTYKIIVKKLNYLRSNDFEKYYQSKISYRGYLRKDIYSLKNEYKFLSNKYLNVIIKEVVNGYGFIILNNISDDTIKSALSINAVCTVNIYNYKKILKFFEDNNLKYIYLEKTKIIFKYND